MEAQSKGRAVSKGAPREFNGGGGFLDPLSIMKNDHMTLTKNKSVNIRTLQDEDNLMTQAERLNKLGKSPQNTKENAQAHQIMSAAAK